MPFLEYYKRNVGEIHLLNGENSVEVVSAKVKEILTNEELLWEISMITVYFIEFNKSFVLRKKNDYF